MFDKALLGRFGKDRASAQHILARELDAFETLPNALLGVWLEPRAPGAWSPAQTTEHVLKVNQGISKTLYLLRRDAPLPEQTRTLGALVEGHAQAPEFSRPGEGQLWEGLKPGWLEMRTRFLAEAEQASGPDAPERTWFHPYFGDLGVLGWLQAASLHMAHHRRQLQA